MSERDLQTVRERWPGVWTELDAQVSGEMHAEEHGKTMVIEGVHLTSAIDREAEAELQARRIPDDADHACVYGFALGDLPRALLRRSTLSKLSVVVLAKGIARLSLERSNHDWLQDPRVSLRIAEETDTPKAPWTVAPACLRMADESAARLRDALELALAAPHQRRRYAEREAMLQRSIADNHDRLSTDGDVQTLFGSRPGATCVVAAGGPSLAESFDWLRRERERVVLISVSTATRPLQIAGLTPDVVVVVDPHPGQIKHFENLEDPPLRQTPLVWVPAVQSTVLDRWPGPRLGAYLDQPRYTDLRSTLPRGLLFCSGTVTHAAADLAVKMGAAEVVLMGADFSYPQGRSHVTGAALERGAVGAHSWVMSGRGERVPSDLTLIGYLRDLEDWIATQSGVDFQVGSAEGARIAGTRILKT